MKVAIVNTWRGGAVYYISHPIYEYLKEHCKDIEFTYLTVREIELTPGFDKSFSEYDLVHFTYFLNAASFMEDLLVPFTCQVHHFGAGSEELYSAQLRQWSPERIVVPETFVQRQLGQRSVARVVNIPYAFDHTPFKPTTYNEEFKVGFLGCDGEAKRFDVIRKACANAGVKYRDFDRNTKNEEVDYLDQEEILEFYDDISCYVCSSWTDGGPLPPQEALLCGRSVITTPVGMMPMLAEQHGLGNWIVTYDGSVNELAKKLTYTKGWFAGMQGDDPEVMPEAIAMEARRCLPSVKMVGERWKDLFTEVLEELE